VSTPPTAGRVLVQALQAQGVDRVFCVPGESYLEVLDALHDAPQIQLVVAKHEGAAADMAEADGKLTGRPGVCMVTRGPGATHASVGVHIAQQDSTPLVLFVGQIARGDTGRDAFQEVDYTSLFGRLAKWVVQVDDPARMAEIVARAFHTAVSGRPGPVVVALPEDVLTQAAPVPAVRATVLQPLAPSPAALQSLQQHLLQARRPLVVVGGSGWSAQAAEALQHWAQRWQLPVACSFRRQDALDNRHPSYVGHLALGMNPALKTLVQEADLLLAIGTRLGDVATDGFSLLDIPRPRHKLLHIHPDADELGRVYQPALALALRSDDAMQALLGLPPPAMPAWADWAARARAAHLAFSRPLPPAPELQGVDLTAVMQHLSEALPDDAIVSNGAGNYAVWLHRFFAYKRPRTQLATTCGTMGYGLPAAIAASLRHPERDCVCVAGDGCFLMYPQELATAIEYGARPLVLVANNSQYGTIRMHQANHYPGRISGTRLHGPDYVALAQSFGAHAERVTRSEDFPAALQRARSSGRAALIELVTDPLQITPTRRLQQGE
jgi:acetolactate synthase I/II/III large subunit